MNLLLLLLSPLLGSLTAQDTVLLTGGFNGAEGARSGCELLDSACSIPSLIVSEGTGRAGRSDHVTVVTEDGLILTCGGESADGTDDLSCQSLDLEGGTWIPHSTLDTDRLKATAVSLPNTGTYILGGFKKLSSSFLPTGASEWETGPTLPGVNWNETIYYGICSVLLSDTSFLVIGGNHDGLLGGTRVQEYDDGTGEWDIWPHLDVERWGHSCTRLGDKVVVAGGVSVYFSIFTSTTVLDLNTRESKEVGQMSVPRTFFGMATLDDRLLVFGGQGGLKRSKNSWGSIEEWDDSAEEWIQTNEVMATAMNEFSWIVVDRTDVCF